jgi:hypothetical protein
MQAARDCTRPQREADIQLHRGILFTRESRCHGGDLAPMSRHLDLTLADRVRNFTASSPLGHPMEDIRSVCACIKHLGHHFPDQGGPSPSLSAQISSLVVASFFLRVNAFSDILLEREPRRVPDSPPSVRLPGTKRENGTSCDR